MIRWFAVVFALLLAVDAHATSFAVVDFERAVNETDEGQAAQRRLDEMYSSRRAEVERLRDDLMQDMEDYQSRSMILSEDARKETERRLMQKQQTFESTYMTYQQEMQQTYMALLEDLDQKMRVLTETIAQEQEVDLVVDKAAVVFHGGATLDLTDALIERYNAQNQ